MSRFSRLDRAIACLTLLAALTATSAVWHAGDDDLACRTILIAGRDDIPRTITSAETRPEPQHCLLCHWNRWVRSVPTSRSAVVLPEQDASRLILSAFVGVTRADCGLTLGRAPPA